MSWREVLRISIEALGGNKFRSLLTMLGMIIGVLSVVLLVSIGEGAKNYVNREFEGLGTNLIIVQPGRTDRRGSFGPPVGAAQRKMTLADVAAIERKSLKIEAVTGLVFGTVSLKNEELVSNINIFGANENFNRILTLTVNEGSFISREEDEFGRRVIVLGATSARDLFGSKSPLGRLIKVNESEFRVIGIIAPVGDKLGFNMDEIAIIPTRAALRVFNDDKLFGIRARAVSRFSMDEAVQEISEILKERRDGEEDFTIVTQQGMMESMGSILDMLTYALVGIAAISMLVGGIGIMNIMLVSVAERTQEIGIRRAVGARRADIVKQFLGEAVLLSFIGGTSGILTAVGLTQLAFRLFPSFDMRAPLWILPPAFLLSILTGTIFGSWPAWNASRIDTLDALRHE